MKNYNYKYIKKYTLKNEIFFEYNMNFNNILEKDILKKFFLEFFNLYNLENFEKYAAILKTDEYQVLEKKRKKYKVYFNKFLLFFNNIKQFLKLKIFNFILHFLKNLYYFFRFLFYLGNFWKKRKYRGFRMYFSIWAWNADLVDPLDFKNWRQTYTYKKVTYYINFYDIKGFFFYIYVSYSLYFLTNFYRILHFIYWESFFVLIRSMTGPLHSPFEKKIISWFNWFVAILWTNPVKERNYYKLKIKSFIYLFVYLDVFEFFFNLKNFIYYYYFYKNFYYNIVINFFFFFFSFFKKLFIIVFFLFLYHFILF